jgi:hypothetical protein
MFALGILALAFRAATRRSGLQLDLAFPHRPGIRCPLIRLPIAVDRESLVIWDCQLKDNESLVKTSNCFPGVLQVTPVDLLIATAARHPYRSDQHGRCR